MPRQKNELIEMRKNFRETFDEFLTDIEIEMRKTALQDDDHEDGDHDDDDHEGEDHVHIGEDAKADARETIIEKRESMISELTEEMENVRFESQLSRLDEPKRQSLAVAGGLITLISEEEMQAELKISDDEISQQQVIADKQEEVFILKSWEIQLDTLRTVMSKKAPHLIERFEKERESILAEVALLSNAN